MGREAEAAYYTTNFVSFLRIRTGVPSYSGGDGDGGHNVEDPRRGAVPAITVAARRRHGTYTGYRRRRRRAARIPSWAKSPRLKTPNPMWDHPVRTTCGPAERMRSRATDRDDLPSRPPSPVVFYGCTRKFNNTASSWSSVAFSSSSAGSPASRGPFRLRLIVNNFFWGEK